MRSVLVPVFFCILALGFTLPAEALHEKTTGDRIDLLSSRIEALEKRQPMIEWIETISISGLIEAEAAYSRYDPAGTGSDEESSDIVLSTMELGVDAAVNEYLGGHILFLWEEDETEPVDLDEAFISVSGGDRTPFYLHAGKFYIPFGHFESYFISDPLTLELGETNESTFLLGYHAGPIDLGAGAFNGDVDKAGENDHIRSFFGTATMTAPETLIPGVTLSAGVSYISNIADADLLSENINRSAVDADATVRDHVGGMSAFLSASAMKRLFFIAEYVGAIDEFAAGELAFGNGSLKPRAWNLEMAYVFDGDFGVGIKYEGTDDGGDLLPETRYGAIVFCNPLAHTYFGVEYLDEEFENNDKNRIVTAQVAYDF